MIFFAHRGAPFYRPENTVLSFVYAQNAGRIFFETDVHLTQEGLPVIHHDEVTKEGLSIATTPASVLKLPTLKSLLRVIRAEDVLNIELKTNVHDYKNIETIVLGEIKGREDQIIISSFNYQTLQNVRALDSKIKISMLATEFSLEKALAINAGSINLSTKYVTKEMVDAAHNAGLRVLVYTVNTKADLVRLDAMGVDGLFSDDPFLAL